MRALALALVLSLGAAPAKAPKPPAKAAADAPVESKAALAPVGHSATGDTRCAACHVTASWGDVRFNHERTGFPLTGAHATTSCQNCHAADFEKPVPRGCVGCHTDVHGADLGARCEGCHDSASWASQFNADAHRRTNFPLLGAHAALPCQECHFEARDTRFARAAVDCASCHQADLMRTVGTTLDHTALGFSGGCQSCHGAYRFTPARFPAHDKCFPISSGSHSNIPCTGCHTSLTGLGVVGTCTASLPVECIGCHTGEHQCSAAAVGATHTDQLHTGQVPLKSGLKVQVAGYKCSNAKCAGCHQGYP